jgi:lipoprotein-anchoring transpeptidase ErfK/SrfK
VTSTLRIAALVSLLAASACEVTTNPPNETAEAPNAAADANAGAASGAAQQAPQNQAAATQSGEQFRDLRVLVDISDRKLRLFQADRMIAEHPVAVGSARWPTPTGSWRIHRVDLNPAWVPPRDEEWAEDREPKAAGAPDNPLGRARLVYRLPNTIHGTNNPGSLGTATSHGSIRVSNEVALQLAQILLQAGGKWEGPERFQQMANDRAREVEIELTRPVPIQVQD